MATERTSEERAEAAAQRAARRAARDARDGGAGASGATQEPNVGHHGPEATTTDVRRGAAARAEVNVGHHGPEATTKDVRAVGARARGAVVAGGALLPAALRGRAGVIAAAAAALLLIVAIAVIRGCGDDGSADRATRTAASSANAVDKPRPAPQLPGGGRRIFPDRRVVAFYGNPSARALGILGIGRPSLATARLRRQAAPYARKTRPILPALELISSVAANAPGQDGLYVNHAPAKTINRYLRAARKAKALLVLDIQPGHADFLTEAKRLRRWLVKPDVGLALDPEWHTPGVVPGSQIGSTTAADVNQVSRYVAGLVRADRLPQKLFIIHEFTQAMVRDKASLITPPELAVTMNVDGFGARPNKLSKYKDFTTRANRPRGTAIGLKLFYEEDTNIFQPRGVMALKPRPDLVVYE